MKKSLEPLDLQKKDFEDIHRIGSKDKFSKRNLKNCRSISSVRQSVPWCRAVSLYICYFSIVKSMRIAVSNFNLGISFLLLTPVLYFTMFPHVSLQVFDSSGSFLSYINTSADPLYGPQGLALTSDGHVAVADSGNHCFKVYRYLQQKYVGPRSKD